MFLIVDLKIEGGLQTAIIPETWVYVYKEEQCCLYPKVKDTQKLVKKSALPNVDSWHCFYINICFKFGKRCLNDTCLITNYYLILDSFDTARKHLMQAAEHSDVCVDETTNDRGKGCRKRRPTSKLDPSSTTATTNYTLENLSEDRSASGHSSADEHLRFQEPRIPIG